MQKSRYMMKELEQKDYRLENLEHFKTEKEVWTAWNCLPKTVKKIIEQIDALCGNVYGQCDLWVREALWRIYDEGRKERTGDRLRVFAAQRIGGYSGGLIMVAAHDIDEAIQTYHTSKYAEDEGLYGEVDGEVAWDYYPAEKWYEVPGVFADYDESRIIDEGGHSE